MKTMTAFLLAVVLPSAAFADGLSTSVSVLTTPQYENFLKAAGDTAEVGTGDLWTSAIHNAYLGKSGQRTLSTGFVHEGRRYELLFTVLHGKALYSILDVTERDNRRLVAAGEIKAGREAKEDVSGEPFVVVSRTGNFRPQ